MSNLIATDLQKQEVDSGLVELFILDLPDHLAESDNSRLYFHAGTDEDLSNITFRDNYSSTISGSTQFHARTYVALPASLEGISIDSEGASARPTITIANAETIFRSAIETPGFTNKDLIGCRVTKRTTLKKHLATGSTNSAPVEFPVSIYIIDRISSEDSIFVQFELTTPYDLEKITLPRRIIIGKYCSWEYQGFQVGDATRQRGACYWKRNSSLGTGLTAYFDETDAPLVPASMFHTGAASTTKYSTYAAGTTYTVSDYVFIGTRYWLSLIDGNVGNSPPDSEGIWQEAKVWSNWAANAGNYIVGNLVKHAPSGTSVDTTIWKCLIAHASTSTKSPVNKSAFWVRADVCGKELGSCAIRYGAQRAKAGTLEFAPSGEESSKVELPFGAFPGTDRFK